MARGRRKLPDRWLDYHPIKNVLPVLKIVPFKTPLPSQIFYPELLRDHRWTPYDLMDCLRDQGWNLGLIVDFTNKFPAYYDPEEFIRNGVSFVKIACVGHDVPKDEYFQKFCEVMEQFLQHESQNNRVVGVHCTHGINRTGYIVCRYLIEKCGYNPDHAISTFAEIRGYPIERENYIEALHNL
ncbi:RNA/RNP complex-1-interacting phosphatase [Parasteatoda tepidariorum]|uniref:RNA/RNP complex-1-interacting phosphatase n=1 Tax=Parasteatoda tepidariorum TaxID=114398 RepID=UPI00077FB1BE|nr:RNA/RNP complex-1-interacting phosphatase-like [Parasteatoda tepidariorum]